MDSTTTQPRSVNSLKRMCRLSFTFSSSSYKFTDFLSHISFYATQSSFRASLSDSFNTPEALTYLRDLVSRTNVYINSQGKSLNIGLVEHVARWVGRMLRMFGLGEGEKSEIGWGQDGGEQGDVNVGFLSIFCSCLENTSDTMETARRNSHALHSDIVVFPGRRSATGDGQRRRRTERHIGPL